jgi:hypothetical protein
MQLSDLVNVPFDPAEFALNFIEIDNLKVTKSLKLNGLVTNFKVAA